MASLYLSVGFNPSFHIEPFDLGGKQEKFDLSHITTKKEKKKVIIEVKPVIAVDTFRNRVGIEETPGPYLRKQPPIIEPDGISLSGEKLPSSKSNTGDLVIKEKSNSTSKTDNITLQNRKLSISDNLNIIATTKTGPIFKLTDNNNLKPYTLTVCYKDIYYYKLDGNTLLGLHNLSGTHIKDFNESEALDYKGKKYYPFTVVFSNKDRTYYSEDKSDAKNWIATIKKAIGYQSFDDVYQIVQGKEPIGVGKFGVVYLGLHKKTQEYVAIKIVKKKEMTLKDIELVKSEIDIMKMCRHQNVIRILDHFESKEYTYIVMEYLSGGTLAEFLEATSVEDLSEKQSAVIVYQIACALDYLHQFGIVHRDLKPENIMIKSKSAYENLECIKIMDFGLSKILGPYEKVSDGFGTLTYVSPEVLTRKPYNKQVDIWSIGVIAYYTLSGSFPFDDESNDEEVIARKIVYDELKFGHKSWKTRLPSSKDFINKATLKDIDKRIKIGDLINHQWFSDCDVKSVKFQKKSSNSSVRK